MTLVCHHQGHLNACTLLTVLVLMRSCSAFIPPLLPPLRISSVHLTTTEGCSCSNPYSSGPTRSCLNKDRRRDSPPSPPSKRETPRLRASGGLDAGAEGINDEDEAAEIAAFIKAAVGGRKRPREGAQGLSGPPEIPTRPLPSAPVLPGAESTDEEDAEEAAEMAGFVRDAMAGRQQERERMKLSSSAAAAQLTASSPSPAIRKEELTLGLDLKGGIFPSDVSQGSTKEDVTLQGVKLDTGRPAELVGFWKLYGATGKREDVSGRVILRADGQVIGGPTVRQTPDVEWSDPEGLKPVGGEWVVYSDVETGRTRLHMTIVLSHQKQQQLEMDGLIMSVSGSWNEDKGMSDSQLQIFGGVSKRNGEAGLEADEGDFSMMMVEAGGDKLIGTVGSQRRRIW